MCNLYSITTNQEAIVRLFRVVNRYVGNLAPKTGVFPDYSAPVIRNAGAGTEIAMMRWACLRHLGRAARRCSVVRYYVARYSEAAAESWGRSKGATDAEIASARRCLRSDTVRTAHY